VVHPLARIIQGSVYCRKDEKPLAWLGSSLADLRSFPADARRHAGHELHLVQKGLSPSDWRPMSSVGAGVVEIRIHTEQEYRVFYVAKFEEAVYVLHAFEKKTQKTPKRDIELARTRYSELVRIRRERRTRG
jgi:phage-related protein